MSRSSAALFAPFVVLAMVKSFAGQVYFKRMNRDVQYVRRVCRRKELSIDALVLVDTAARALHTAHMRIRSECWHGVPPVVVRPQESDGSESEWSHDPGSSDAEGISSSVEGIAGSTVYFPTDDEGLTPDLSAPHVIDETFSNKATRVECGADVVTVETRESASKISFVEFNDCSR